MMTGRKIIGLACAATLMLAACGGSEKKTGEDVDFKASPTGTVKTLGFNPSDEVGTSRADYAKTQLGEATVEMDTANFDAQKFATLAAAGNLPDVVQMDRLAVPTYAQQGLIMPLDQCFEAQGIKAKEYWYPAIIDETSYDGKMYAVPQFFQPAMLMINKRLTEGVSAEQFDTSKPDQILKLAGDLTKLKGAQPTQLGFDPDMPGSVDLWIQVFGGKLMDGEGKPALDDPANVEAFKFLGQLMKAQGGYAEVTSFKQTWDVFGDKNQYVTDQLAAGLWAQWYINVLSNTKDKVEMDATALKDKDGKALGYAGGSALTIPATAKNPAAACKWITSLTSLDAWKAAGEARSKTIQEKKAINTGLFTGSPAADKAVRDAYVKPTGIAGFDKMIEVSYEVLSDARTFGSSPVGVPISDALKQAAGVALSGEKSPEEALKEAQSKAMTAWDNLKKK